jgi:hypothetical protein
MDSEGDPFETPLEREYNRLLDELANQKIECESRIVKIVSKIGCAGGSSSGDDSEFVDPAESSSGDFEGSGNQSGHKQLGDSSSSQSGDVGPRHNSTSFVDGGVANYTVHGNDTAASQNVSRPSIYGPYNSSADGLDNGTGCPPCPILRDVCGPTSTSPGDSGTTTLATPEAILVGAAAAVLILAVAATVAILVRYLPTITSGLLIVATIVLVWYLSSMYPEAARRLGARLLEALRRAATSIVDRVFRRHHPEVSVKYCMCRGICEEMVFKESKDKERVGV